jgi:PAS domain S-box-containing protein
MPRKIRDSATHNAAADTATDITERKQVEERLRETSDYLNNLLDYANAPIIVWDAAYHITLFNHAFERLTGRSASSVVGKEIDLLFPPDKREESLANIRRASLGERWETVEIDIQHVDGSIRTLLWNSASLHAPDGTTIVSTIAQGQDITERTRLEQKVTHLASFPTQNPYPVIEVGTDGVVRFANAAAVTTLVRLGLDPDARQFLPGTPEELVLLRSQCEKEPQKQELRLGEATFLRAVSTPGNNTLRVFATEITERKRAEEALAESEKKLRTLFETMSEGIVYEDHDGKIISANPAAERLLGLSLDQMQGRTSLDPRWKAIREDGSPFPGETHSLRIAAMTGKPGRDEIQGIYNPQLSAYTWLSINSTPEFLPGGKEPFRAYAVFRDITERKRAEEEIRTLNAELEERVRQRTAELTAAHSELQIILDSVPAWVFYKDTENRFVRVNQVFADVMGMTKMQLEGKSLTDLYPADQADAYGADDREVMASGSPRSGIIEPVLSPAGKLWVRTDKIPYRDSNGDIIGIIGFTEDITKRKTAEDNLILRSAQLEAANKELEAFSYSVSHDLRAPLRSIDGFSQAFLEDFGTLVPMEGREDLERVRRATQRMGQLIDDMLQLSQVTRSKMHVQEIDMTALAAEVAGDLARDNPQRDVHPTIEPGMAARGDPQLMRIVLVNLLGNAWKFTLHREHAHISVGTVRDPQRGLAFFVRDDGAGFDPKYKDKLFVAFQRLHSLEEFPGTGIGLATVQRAVRRHGGNVWAEGEVDRGATFYFTISDLPPSIPTKEEQL